MIVRLKCGEEVEILSVSGEDDDIQIEEAVYLNNDEHVSDSDLEEIYIDHSDELYTMWVDRGISRVDFDEEYDL